MKKFITQLTTVLTLLFTVNVNAGLLSLDLSNDNVNIGESVTVTINAQDFDATDMFWFDLNFDGSMLTYDESSLSSDLLLVNEDIGMFDGLAVASDSFGMSFDFFDIVMSAENNFMLASFEIIATTAGMTSFAVADFFNAEAFDDYDVAFTGSSSVTINAVAVPEPSSVFIMLIAGFALVTARVKQK